MSPPHSPARRLLVGAAVALGIRPDLAAANGSGYPVPGRAVRLVVPYPAGGGGDAVARRVAPVLAKRLGTPVIVDNRPGGATTIGAALVAQAAPDGHTLFINVPSFITLLPFQLSKLPYDPHRDFTPITPLIRTGLVLTAHPSVPATDVASLVTHARAHPAKLAYASWNPGGGSHLFMELLKRRAGIDVLHIPYKGLAEIHPDLLQNRVQLVLDATRQGLEYIRAGRLRALGIVGERRVAGLPDVPTFEEQGFPGYTRVSGLSVFGPRGMPDTIVQRLYREISGIVHAPAMQEFLTGFGFTPHTQLPAAFARQLRDEANHWKPIVAELGIRLD